MNLSRSIRLGVAVALASGGATVLVSTPAQAAQVTATLVATRSTSTGTWAAAPSPDPSGITYDPVNRRLVLSDGEVDETRLHRGTNVFFASLGGKQTARNRGWTTVPWSHEAVGITHAVAGRVLVPDDDTDRVYSVRVGANGRPISRATPASFSVRPLQGDPEDVTPERGGHLLVVDGVNKAVYDYGPGSNRRFDGVPAAHGDDTVAKLDVGRYGALDPEGIEYHPTRNTILVLDSRSKRIYELGRDGSLRNIISIAAAKPRMPAGITLAPASNGSGRQNLYIVDRGVDNDTNPNENDGRFYEMSVSFPR